jgi:hypothetical protein
MAMARYFTFHLTLNGHRTTVSLDALLAQFVAVSLGVDPVSREAHGAVREWVAKSLTDWPAFDPDLPISAQVRKLALRRIVDKELAVQAEAYGVF